MARLASVVSQTVATLNRIGSCNVLYFCGSYEMVLWSVNDVIIVFFYFTDTTTCSEECSK